jgi:hypothetical protein
MGKSHFKKAITSLEARIAEPQLQLSELSDRVLKIRNGDRVLMKFGSVIAVLVKFEGAILKNNS